MPPHFTNKFIGMLSDMPIAGREGGARGVVLLQEGGARSQRGGEVRGDLRGGVRGVGDLRLPRGHSTQDVLVREQLLSLIHI